MKTQQYQRGISLLEILLVVLVAAGIVSAAITYYSQTMRNSKVSETVNFIQQVNKAGYEWLQILGADPRYPSQYPSDFSGLSTAPNQNGLQYFVNAQLISCENNSCFKNPWGGFNSVTVGSNPKYMLITIFGITKADCALLQQQMQNIAPQGLPQQNYCQNLLGGEYVNYSVSL